MSWHFPTRITTPLAWASLALGAVLFVTGFALLLAVPTERQPTLFWPEALSSVAVLGYIAVGALVAARRPRNPIGWIFCGIGLVQEIRFGALGYVSYALISAPATLPAVPVVALLLHFWVLAYQLMPLVFLLFPNGRPISSRWRAIVWLTAAAAPAMLLALVFRPGPIVDDFPSLLNPFAPQDQPWLTGVIISTSF